LLPAGYHFRLESARGAAIITAYETALGPQFALKIHNAFMTEVIPCDFA